MRDATIDQAHGHDKPASAGAESRTLRRVVSARGNASIRNTRLRAASSGVLIALILAACGSSQPKVGDCVDSQRQVVDCTSSSATLKLVSDQSGPNAIACVEIGNKPELSIKIGSGTFCAESVSNSQ